MKTTVVNLRRSHYDVYIGRAGKGQSGCFGNPYSLRDHGHQAMALFESYFQKRVEEDPEFRRRVLELRGKRLGCFCKPGPCHGDVIKRWLDGEEPRQLDMFGNERDVP